MRVTSVYIHIPFCRRKCNYCDFASTALYGHEQELAAYPTWLRQELALYQPKLDLSHLETIYFGGGTPSLLTPQQVAEILSWFPPAGEITLEANPETVEGQRLHDYRQAGINRLSLGIQSFQPALLSAMGRGHSAAQAKAAVAAARQAGLENINLDLIYGLPAQTLAMWQEDLTQALALESEHISLYGLTLHEGTPWGDDPMIHAADQDLSADMLELAIDRLAAAGYRHYEIANFARPGFASRHNCAYWQRENYLGLGVAAASCLAERRFANHPTLAAYAAALAAGKRPVAEEETLTIDQVLAEAMFLGLRLEKGVVAKEFYRRYGADPLRRYHRELARMQKLGLLETDDGVIRLTRRGLLLGNEVFAEFL